jgi:predicted DNA binding CopG/RHH family protein
MSSDESMPELLLRIPEALQEIKKRYSARVPGVPYQGYFSCIKK